MPKSRWIGFLTVILFTVALSAAEDPLLRAVRAKLQQILPFTVEFNQLVTIEGQPELEENGQIFIQDFRRMLWKYNPPSAKVFLLQDSEYRFYQPAEEQLLIGRLNTGRDQMIWQLLDSPDPTQTVRSDARKRTITIRMNRDENDVEYILYLDRENLLIRVTQTDGSGVLTRFQFSKYRPKAVWNPELFRLQVPPGTEIIDERGD